MQRWQMPRGSIAFFAGCNGLISRGGTPVVFINTERGDLALGISIGSESSPSSALLYDDAPIPSAIGDNYEEQHRLVPSARAGFSGFRASRQRKIYRLITPCTAKDNAMKKKRESKE
jgi:hypothetical protein